MRFMLAIFLAVSGISSWAGSADKLVVAKNDKGQLLFLRTVRSGRIGAHEGTGVPAGRFYQWDPIILDAAAYYAVDPYYIKAIGLVESRFQKNAVSPAGARGPWQFMPRTAAQMGVEDPHDPIQAIWGCAALVRRLVDAYNGDLRLVAAAYNAGEPAVNRARGIPNNPETRKYVPDVLWAWDDMQRH